jgi:hypothetical protein
MKTFDEEAVVNLGKDQVDAIFRRQETPGHTLDDRDFIPILEAVVSTLEKIGLSPASVEAIWDHAYAAYDRMCREADPSFTFEENRALMQRYLVGPRRSAPGKTRKRSR